MNDKEGYVVSCNEQQDEWYVIRRKMKGGVMHKEGLAPSYRTEEDATEAMIRLIEAER